MCTTAGDIEIELWPKEAPKACRNFVQLALEGYYDNTIFHRVVPGFIVQGGDPTGTGMGGESIYGEPFPNEFHSRLRFVRRGLLGVASSEPNDNGSQFFITLGPTPELQRKHTIFGTVVGDTLFNALKIGEGEIVPETERPEHPHKVTRIRIIDNPFDDIVPRITSEERRRLQERKAEDATKKKGRAKAKRDKNLLSFNDDEENSGDISTSSATKFKIKSSHDVLADDKMLSRQAATGAREEGGRAEAMQASLAAVKGRVESLEGSKPAQPRGEDAPKILATDSTDESDGEFEERMRRSVLAKKKGFVDTSERDKRLAAEQEIKKLEQDIADIDRRKAEREGLGAQGSPAEGLRQEQGRTPLQQEMEKYAVKAGLASRRKIGAKGRAEREDSLLAKLEQFKSKLRWDGTNGRSSNQRAPEAGDTKGAKDGSEACPLHHLLVCESCNWNCEGASIALGAGARHKDSKAVLPTHADDNDDSDEGWMRHRLHFQKDRQGVDSEYAPKVEDYKVIDPRVKEEEVRHRRRHEEQRSSKHKQLRRC
ncbi:Peptidyl-prolyl isomerase cwc27 [Spiromyces aspiralis]|uniref:Peptidyl-prolyl isomerase cwc27 n=1 Tax=Spiromyces aspiralis TaxID=68401 RepID=A0ACC1HFP3_9FUNG|nr:Peptidyl-prolyl isomerase cwc27 [Spiromyces aspiralis]